MKLEGKKALVTGSDSGIGRAIALTFAKEGADVAIVYHHDRKGIEETQRGIIAAGRKAVLLQADFSNPERAADLFKAAVNELGPIDILVNDAGTDAPVETSEETTFKQFMEVLNVDLIAPWVLCQAAIAHMAHLEKGGVIINVTSVHEEIPSKGGVAYDAAKAALRNVTRTLSRETAEKGIRINNIAPGLIQTPMTADRLEDPEKAKKATARIPMKRFGQPQEVANVALFLASTDSSYVTGSSYFVDGGLMQQVGSGA
jgi:glucose 1-dehydrogenase